jgi:hypothetical protein
MTQPKLIEKSDAREASEKAAVQQMIGTKKAMTDVLSRVYTLENAIVAMQNLANELSKLTPPTAGIKIQHDNNGRFCSDARFVTAEIITCEINRIAKMAGSRT